MNKKCVLIEFGNWYEIPTIYKYLANYVLEMDRIPIFYSFEKIPPTIIQNWELFKKFDVYLLDSHANIKRFVKFIRTSQITTYFMKSPTIYFNLSLIKYFQKRKVNSYTLISDLMGVSTYDKYFSRRDVLIDIQENSKNRITFIFRLLFDLFYRFRNELTRLRPLLYFMPVPKSYFMERLNNYHQYLVANSSKVLVSTSEEVLILKEFFNNQEIGRYLHPFKEVQNKVQIQNRSVVFFVELLDSLKPLEGFPIEILGILHVNGVSSSEKIIFQFHPRETCENLEIMSDALRQVFLNIEFSNHHNYDNLILNLDRASIVFTPVSTVAKLSFFYRPDLEVIIYDPIMNKYRFSRNCLVGTPNGPNFGSSIKAKSLRSYIL